MRSCPDCGGELESGSIMDHRGEGMAMVQQYAKSEVPTTPLAFFMGLSETDFTNVRRVVTYRCVGCNRLYSYAQDRVIMSSYPGYGQRLILIVMIFVVVVIFLTLFVSGM